MTRFATELAARPARALLFAGALAIAGCASALSDAKSDFKRGRYADAKATLVRIEPDSRGWGDGKRAEYALYRGLVHGALGDRAAASMWLREARAIEDAHPGTLSADDAARLRLASDSLGVGVAAPAP